MEKYLTLRNKLEKLSSDWDKGQGLDASFIQVKMYGDWRKKKKVGCKKGYNGWTFFSTSTNSNGYDLYEEIKKLTDNFDDLTVTERQLQKNKQGDNDGRIPTLSPFLKQTDMSYIEREYDRYLESLQQSNECFVCGAECEDDVCSSDCLNASLL